MLDFIIIPISAIAYRFRGGGIMPCPDGFRKPIYCIATGAAFGLLAWDIWAGIIVGVGSLLPALTSPRPLFWGWQGVYRSEEVKPNILNGWMHWLAFQYGYGSPTKYALVYGTCRGLFELPTTIALAMYYHNWWIAPVGFLGGFMGIVYYAAGKLSKDNAVMWAELGYGALRGVIILSTIR